MSGSEIVEGYPLAAQQRRLWELARDGVSTVELTVTGPLDPARLRDAWAQVAQRHEVLRTRFAQPAHHRFPLQVVDAGPIADPELAQDGPGRWRVTIRVPTLVADTASLHVIAGELAAAYRGEPLPEPVQYAQFAAWQESVRSPGSVPDDPAQDGAAIVGLGGDGPRPGTLAGFTGFAPRAVPVPPVDPATLRACGVPVKAVLLAAWALVLSRRTGATELVLGDVFDSRPFDELRTTVGLLARTLPVTVAIPPSIALPALAREVAARLDEVADGLVTGRLPGADTDPVGLPLQFEHVSTAGPGGAADASGNSGAGAVAFAVTHVAAVSDPFDVRLVAAEREGAVDLAVWAGSGDRQLAGDLADAVATLLRDPAAGAVPGLSERARLLAWTTGRPAPLHLEPIPAVFRRVAARAPQAPALVDAERRMSYADLDVATDRLAHALRARGVGPESVVALPGERHADTVVGMVGILKAGGAFLPVPADSPDELVRRLVLGAAADLLLSTTGGQPWPSDLDVPRLDLAGAVRDAPGGPVADPGTDPQNLAYVVYTSGSTGWPKGVAVTHANVVHYVAAITERLGLRPGWSYATVAAPAADLGYTALFGALLTGGCLHLPGRDVLLDPAAFGRYLHDESIDCVKTTPSHFAAVLAAAPEGKVFPRRLLVLGGEAIDPAWLSGVLDRAGGCAVANHYGPTETCVGVLAARLSVADCAGPVPMGTPLDRTTVELLDVEGHPVPVGVPGEVHIGGPGVARGYRGRPDLTAQRFFPDPDATRPGARRYRTGDLAFRRADGAVVFCGRVDDQVKIRGYRVEPQAVAGHLREHPAVAQAVVLVRRFVSGQDGLAAYVVPTAEHVAAQAAALGAGQVQGWTDVFDDVYRDGMARPDSGTEFDLTGWTSSYTGETLPDREIAESIDGVLRRLSGLPARTVLEIGCGTGLLLLRIAPLAQRYWATDVSGAVLATVRRAVDAAPQRYPGLALLRREASDFTGFADDSLDLVILNSVVQYFPSVEYLRAVLREAVRVTRPGGAILVGDVRDLRLVEAFHASVELYRADPATPAGEARQRVRAAVGEEGELLLAPAFFADEVAGLPGVADVRLELKWGEHANELTEFRYDALLRVGAAPADPPESLTLPFAPGPLEEWASRAASAEAVVVTDVPDGRTAADVARWQALTAAPADATVPGLEVGEAARAAAVAPGRWWELAPRHGLTVSVQPPRSGRPGRYDVALSRSGALPRWRPRYGPARPYSLPYHRRLSADLARELREHLQARLPDYMLPNHLVVLGELPLSPTGKLDVARLPEPAVRASAAGVPHVPPSTPVEELVAGVWSDVLAVEEVGVLDDFFKLGGHSLLAVQTVYRLKEAVGVDLTLRDFFARPTVAELSIHLAGLLLEEVGR
jgi:amino acid adenylation domain-containing protein